MSPTLSAGGASPTKSLRAGGAMYAMPSVAVMAARMAGFNQDRRLIRLQSPLPPEDLVAQRVRMSESVSRPFRATVNLLSVDSELSLEQIVGHPLGLIIPTPTGDRYFHGYVHELRRTNRTDSGLIGYEAQLRPWFFFLEHQVNCQIFQDCSVLDIVESIFQSHGAFADYRLDLRPSTYEKIKYCTQYNESDFAFVSRLLEDAGIYYYFEHHADRHTLVLADDSSCGPMLAGDPAVYFQPTQALQREGVLDDWRPRRQVATVLHSVKSFDFKQPRHPLLADSAANIPIGKLPRFEQYRYEGAARYLRQLAGQSLATRQVEESTWPTELFDGEGDCRTLATGYSFELEDYPAYRELDKAKRSFFIVEADHEGCNNFLPDFSGAEDSTFRSRITSLRRQVLYRPPRTTPKTRMQGPQTATVVGPAGEELWVDPDGRIKIQFHWDRKGQFDDGSSCWIRVASPWAGGGMGGVSPPRIGHEVVVEFLDGDPDRPIVTSRVYNGDNPPPFGKEVSGMKSKTLHGQGSNEMTMHDRAGAELLNMNAQRDMATAVGNDQTTSVKNNQTTTVENDQTTTVNNNQTITVKNDQTIAVKGKRSVEVTGAVEETFKTGQTLTIEAVGYTETITGPFQTALTGDYTSERDGKWSEIVTGTSERQVGQLAKETLLAGHEFQVEGDEKRTVTANVEDSNGANRTVQVGGEMTQNVGKALSIYSVNVMSLGSGDQIVLGVGGSSITIEPEKITLSSNGSELTIEASGISLSGPKINLN